MMNTFDPNAYAPAKLEAAGHAANQMQTIQFYCTGLKNNLIQLSSMQSQNSSHLTISENLEFKFEGIKLLQFTHYCWGHPANAPGTLSLMGYLGTLDNIWHHYFILLHMQFQSAWLL